jgi:hypothetical protein
MILDDLQSIISNLDGQIYAANQGIPNLTCEIYPKIEVGAIHEAAVLFGGSPRIKPPQNKKPTRHCPYLNFWAA